MACAHWVLTTLVAVALTMLFGLTSFAGADWRTDLAFAAFIAFMGFALGGLGLWLPAALFRGALACLPGRPGRAHLVVGGGLALAYAGLYLGLLLMYRTKAVDAGFYRFLQTVLLPWAGASLVAGLWLLPHSNTNE
ncbi:hypothetical protein MTP16_21835 [Hymenobacter monticola]|uniref:Uncharacterized protein n=1 Tax=Hymenobacter monticola TaxID=1705399 RepID=A0ABY4B4L9_9BACT|nr:hypothetical protein [Hymenobacter monticola]UOE33749.1 hypothetical protein MTP16_21835 [Hymenobacter monticola]